MIWQPDSDATECFLCDESYTLFNRRHHCRKCGRVVCGDCSRQKVKWFPNSRAVQPDGSTIRVVNGEALRTCDECVEEILMIRGALFGSSERRTDRTDRTDDPEGIDNPQQSQRPSPAPVQDSAAPDDDDNLCPVCGRNLLRLYVKNSKSVHQDTLKEEFEHFKETHINECLVAFDFDSDHARLRPRDDGSRGGGARNRMLVYNIAPIPQPRYEVVSEDNPCGSVTSTGLQPQEKQEAECVICLEDLKLGDKVGRLECLCVFHYKCIKDWFNRKGYGQCPVHY